MSLGFVFARVFRNATLVRNPRLVANNAWFGVTKERSFSVATNDESDPNGETDNKRQQDILPDENNLTKDRSIQIPVETSIRYLQSQKYLETYQGEPVWVPYRRNHKGAIPPKLTRKTCIRKNKISVGSPCPICRDEFLVLHYSNIELLKQFISPYNGEVLSYSVTGVCQRQFDKLMVAILLARDKGLLPYQVPF